jgi:hypothetical protein
VVPYYRAMSMSPIPFPPTGFAAARDAARRAWLTLAVVALVPGWSVARVIPGFLAVGDTAPLSHGAPNIWSIVQMLPWIGNLPLAGLAMAIAVGAAAWLAAHFSAKPPRGEASLRAALLIALTLPGLLPFMQPRDFLLAVALSGSLAIRQRSLAIVAPVVISYLLAITGHAWLGALPMIAATALLTRPFLASPANDNGLPLNVVMACPAKPNAC